MTTLGARPELAAQLKHGLMPPNPIYERVGGIIRRVDNKRIVTRLRDVGKSQQMDKSVLRDLGPLLQLHPATSLLTLSVTAVEFAVVTARLRAIEHQLETVSKALEEISRKLDLSFYANFRDAARQRQG